MGRNVILRIMLFLVLADGGGWAVLQTVIVAGGLNLRRPVDSTRILIIRE